MSQGGNNEQWNPNMPFFSEFRSGGKFVTELNRAGKNFNDYIASPLIKIIKDRTGLETLGSAFNSIASSLNPISAAASGLTGALSPLIQPFTDLGNVFGSMLVSESADGLQNFYDTMFSEENMENMQEVAAGFGKIMNVLFELGADVLPMLAEALGPVMDGIGAVLDGIGAGWNYLTDLPVVGEGIERGLTAAMGGIFGFWNQLSDLFAEADKAEQAAQKTEMNKGFEMYKTAMEDQIISQQELLDIMQQAFGEMGNITLENGRFIQRNVHGTPTGDVTQEVMNRWNDLLSSFQTASLIQELVNQGSEDATDGGGAQSAGVMGGLSDLLTKSTTSSSNEGIELLRSINEKLEIQTQYLEEKNVFNIRD